MLAFKTYLHWISKNLPIYGDIPWLGLKPLLNDKPGDAVRGEKIFNTYCSACHSEHYQGKLYAPPLWGEGSFNDGAGFNTPERLASFIYWNMPYDDSTPVLSEDEACDVAAYILTQATASFISVTDYGSDCNHGCNV